MVSPQPRRDEGPAAALAASPLPGQGEGEGEGRFPHLRASLETMLDAVEPSIARILDRSLGGREVTVALWRLRERPAKT